MPAFDGGNHLVGDALLVDELGIVGGLELAPAVGLQPVRLPDATPALALMMPAACAIMAAVQCVVSPGGSASVSATTRSATSGPRGGMREGRVLLRNSPRSLQWRSAPASATRRSRFAGCRMISTVPVPLTPDMPSAIAPAIGVRVVGVLGDHGG